MKKTNSHYTTLALIKDEPDRIIPLINNFKKINNLLVLLDHDDILTERVLADNSVAYVRRPIEYEKWQQPQKTQWVIDQSNTKYVFVCYASFFVPQKLLNLFDVIAEEQKYDAVKSYVTYYGYGGVVQIPAFLGTPKACHFFNKEKIAVNKSCIHEEYILLNQAIVLNLPNKKELSLHVFRDDDTIGTVSKHIGYARREALELNRKNEKVNAVTIIYKLIYSFVNNYFRMGGYRFGIKAFIFHMHYFFYQFMVYSFLWELQNNCIADKNKENHIQIKNNLIKEDCK
ncbi:hypothetical protein G6729_01670 [Polynucleobacter paneuropaeus]|nr:hypothetical protein G6729_01670 [Polynucleobacter paneuropaeus]